MEVESTDIKFINVTPDGGVKKAIKVEGVGETPLKGCPCRSTYLYCEIHCLLNLILLHFVFRCLKLIITSLNHLI